MFIDYAINHVLLGFFQPFVAPVKGGGYGGTACILRYSVGGMGILPAASVREGVPAVNTL